MTEIRDKVVWITGASSGIGAEAARQIARKGAKLVLSSRNEEALRKVKEEIGLSDSEVLVLPVDITQYYHLQEAVDTVMRKFGRIDVLFSNAGVSQRSKVDETKMEVYEELLRTNFLGLVALVKVVLPVFKAQGNGHFMVTSSVAGKIATGGRSGYCASKHALHGFFDALRTEVTLDNIFVTIFCPGYIRTDISKHALGPDGMPHGRDDKNQMEGMPVELCVKKMIRSVEKNKSEVYIGGKEIFGIYLKRFVPGILEKIVLKRNLK